MSKTCDQNPKKNHLKLQEKGRYFSYKFKYWLGWALITGLLIELTGVEVGPVCFIAFVDFWPSADFYNRPKIDDCRNKINDTNKRQKNDTHVYRHVVGQTFLLFLLVATLKN